MGIQFFISTPPHHRPWHVQVDASQLHDMEARATRAESRAAHLEAQLETLQVLG